jgi:hypothetical protein
MRFTGSAVAQIGLNIIQTQIGPASQESFTFSA